MSEHHPGDVGGQKTLRTYWRNYFERTDTLVWVRYIHPNQPIVVQVADTADQVVDATDRTRLHDCKDELHKLLLEEARLPI
jgi:ADP-ribosylation factor-like protein 2